MYLWHKDDGLCGGGGQDVGCDLNVCEHVSVAQYRQVDGGGQGIEFGDMCLWQKDGALWTS